jgi:hypothetical protein
MPALSPRTQQLQAGMNAGPDQETALFEQGMSEMAYNLLSSRMPDVVPDVVTFKVLNVDLDKGSGVGAFVVLRHDQPIYIPVVMVDNAIKPLEVFFHKAMNVFLPLNKGWLDEIDKTALSALGTGVKTPETLYTDVDIRNVVVPPITGRFSYAAWLPKALVDLERVMTSERLEKEADVHVLGLPTLLAQAPNSIKRAYAAFLEKYPRVLKHAAATYSVQALATALQPRLEKVAAKQHHGGALWIVDKDNTPTDFRRVFGDKAGEAYAGVRKKGFAARDERLNRNMAVQEQPYRDWTEPQQPGIYGLYASDGKESYAFVMPNPIDLFDTGTRYGRRPAIPSQVPREKIEYGIGRPHDHAIHRDYGTKPYLAVFGNGDYIEPEKLVGCVAIADDITGRLHERLFTDVSGAPKTGKGFFIRQKGTTYQATCPMTIKSITTGEDGVRRIRATGGDFGPEKTIATDPAHPYNTIWMPKGADIVYLPADFIWVPLKERLNEKSWYGSVLDLQQCFSSMLSAVGAKKIAIKDAGARQFSINGSMGLERIAALKKLAHEHVLSVDVADALLTKAAEDSKVVAWVASPTQLARVQMRLDKLAADDDKKSKSDSDKPKKKSPPSNGGPPGADAGMDDGSGLGPEAAMAAMGPPPPPPPPAPLDLAAMEMDQAIQHEMQKLVEKQQTIQMLLQRSHEIGGGAPVAPMVQSQAMGAPPPSMNLATGGAPTMGPSPMGPQPGQPPMGGQPGTDPSLGGDPSMMGGDPSMMGGSPPMDPAMGGGAMPPGGDPSMMGGQPGMDPAMGGMPPSGDPSMMGGQPPPMAMMPPDGPNASSLPQEVNPQFLDQAAQLHSADMFDAAAVATLAQSPALHGVVAQYLPNLEKSIDNLARVLLTLWMQEPELKPQIGEQTFSGLEEAMQSTFKGLGELVLRLSRGVQAVKEPGDHAT